jgi:hypothetical protein
MHRIGRFGGTVGDKGLLSAHNLQGLWQHVVLARSPGSTHLGLAVMPLCGLGDHVTRILIHSYSGAL